jgi:hypothetical protein
MSRFAKLFGVGADSTSPSGEYEPVYGLPRRRVEEWLACNPHLREQYEVEEWLVRNPPLREEYDAVRRQKLLALKAPVR